MDAKDESHAMDTLSDEDMASDVTAKFEAAQRAMEHRIQRDGASVEAELEEAMRPWRRKETKRRLRGDFKTQGGRLRPDTTKS